MKSTKPRGRKPRRSWSRILGYGGTVALVIAAVVVLLMPLLDTKTTGTAAGGQQTPTVAPSGGQPVPGTGQVPQQPSNPGQPQQSQTSGTPYPGSQNPGSNNGGGPPMPGTGSGTITWCPVGTALYRQVGAALEVDVKVAGSGFVRAEVIVRGGRSTSQQATVRGGRLHTFKFPGIAVAAVQRVKITTLTGLTSQSCYAGPGG